MRESFPVSQYLTHRMSSQTMVSRMDMAHWIPTVPHLVGHITLNPSSLPALSHVREDVWMIVWSDFQILIPLLVSFPYHTLHRVLFYEDDEEVYSFLSLSASQ